MKLKTEHVEYEQVDFDDLDTFINFHFFNGEKGFEFVADEEANNYSSYEYSIDGKVAAYSRRGIDDRDTSHMTRNYLNEACRLGLLEAGKYLVKVSW